MSLTGGHLDALLAAGATAEQIVALVKADMAEREAATEERRAKDRERQRRHRESRDVTVTERDGCDKSSLEVSPQPPLPKPSKQSPLSPPKSKSVEVPDWMPAEEWAAFKEMRRKMRGIPFTEAAERTVIAKIGKLKTEGHDPAKLLSKAVERGHRTVFEDETTRAMGGDKREPTAQELRERAEWFIRHGRPDDAEECRRKAIRLEQRAAA
jgi:hypothetical protein